MAKRQFGIFFLDANKAYFFGSNASSTLQADVSADIMSYWDILSRDKFYQLIATLITNNKIEPVPVLLILAPSASLEMEGAVGKKPEEVNNDFNQFVEAVPYEKIMSRVYKVQEKTKIVVVNKDVYEAVKVGFEKLHFPTVGVVPFALLQKVMPDVGNSLNFEVLAAKFDAIKQYSIITADEIANPVKSSSSEDSTPKEKSNPLTLYGLVGVFGVLLIVLGYMVYTTMQPVKKPAILPTPTPVIQVTSIPTAIPTVVQKEGSASAKVVSPSPRLSPTSSLTR